MIITRQLTESFVNKITTEYHELLLKINNNCSDDAGELRDFIAKKLRQLDGVKLSLSYVAQDPQGRVSDDLRTSLRRMKLELRFARRRWLRFATGRERFLKAQHTEKHHVPEFAA